MTIKRTTQLTVAITALAAVLVWALAPRPEPPGAVVAVPVEPAPLTFPGLGASPTGVTPASVPAVSASRGLPQVSQKPPAAAEVNLWQLDRSAPEAMFDGTPAARLHADPGVLDNLRVGQVLTFDIPQLPASVRAKITTTSNLTPRTQIWQGAVVDGQPLDNVVVARGQAETHVTIATSAGSYSAVIDNATGETLLVDEADITENQIPFEDGIAIEPVMNSQPPATH